MLEFLKYRPETNKDDFDLCFDTSAEADKILQDDIVVSDNLDANYESMKKILHLEVNGDIVTRTFLWHINSADKKIMIIFADGMVKRESINQFVLEATMQKNFSCSDSEIARFFAEKVMPQNQTTLEKSLNKIAASVNFGNAGILIDGASDGIIIDIKSWEHRNISEPVNETVVQGPHEGFNEILRCNTAIMRKTVNNSDLVFETFCFGKNSRTPSSLAYIDGIINPELLLKIRGKLSQLDGDYVFSVFDIQKKLEERKNLPLPQIITTERPDKACRALVEGRAVLIVNGSPHALILPSNITDIMSSPEDAYLRKPYSLFIRFIRFVAVILSLLTPGLYLAITRFHPETLFTPMILSLAAERGGVPFSALAEILIMELSFELIKEAGVRIPGSIGSSLGIVGGLILGQAAVSAGLVSPITIILVSVCGIASFAIPSYQLSFAFRVSRFLYVFAGAYCGIVGIACALVVQASLVLGTKSFGVPFFAPFSPKASPHPFLNMFFCDYSGIPVPPYMKSGRKGDKTEH